MNNLEPEQAAIGTLIRWGETQPRVRAMLLTSSRAVPGGVVDHFSDYDVILALTDILPFHQERGWLEAFGRVLVMYRDPIELQDGCRVSDNVVQFESGLKIDFSLWEVEALRRIAAAERLPDELDAGYRVLLDKDGLTAGLQPPSYKAFIPVPPAESVYLEYTECILLEAIYVAKLLRRGDLMAAQFVLNQFMRHEHTLPLLEWHMEIEHGWSVKPGPYGRRLQQTLRPDLWEALLRTYTGPGPDETWQATLDLLALYRKAAIEVGAALGFTYPEERYRRTLAYLSKVKKTNHRGH
jgi:aminoglycoside 6-adenylyltransferase